MKVVMNGAVTVHLLGLVIFTGSSISFHPLKNLNVASTDRVIIIFILSQGQLAQKLNSSKFDVQKYV